MREPWRDYLLPNNETELSFGVRPLPCPFCAIPILNCMWDRSRMCIVLAVVQMVPWLKGIGMIFR